VSQIDIKKGCSRIFH